MLARDEGIRSDTTPEKLAALKPSFRPDGTITAGNASPLNDGASALLMGSELAATRIGGDPVARIAGRGAAALEPPMFGYAPVTAAEIALRRAGITWREVVQSSSMRRSRCTPWCASTPGVLILKSSTLAAAQSRSGIHSGRQEDESSAHLRRSCVKAVIGGELLLSASVWDRGSRSSWRT
jgi:Thiolase, N-terminal domain